MSLIERVKLWRELTRYEVEGKSMVPALNPGDWIFVRKVNSTNWQLSDFQELVGEIVVIEHNGLAQLKRLMEVKIENGAIQIYVLGDNSEASTDSRHFGFIPGHSLKGVLHRRYGHKSERRSKRVNRN
jgi:signal peptidase I